MVGINSLLNFYHNIHLEKTIHGNKFRIHNLGVRVNSGIFPKNHSFGYQNSFSEYSKCCLHLVHSLIHSFVVHLIIQEVFIDHPQCANYHLVIGSKQNIHHSLPSWYLSSRKTMVNERDLLHLELFSCSLSALLTYASLLPSPAGSR